MKTIAKYTMLLFLAIFCSCSTQTQKYNEENVRNFYRDLQKVKQNAIDFYQIENMYSHYPDDFSLDSVSSHMWAMSFEKLEQNNSKSEFSCFVLKHDEPKEIDSTLYTKYTPFNRGFNFDEYCTTVDSVALTRGLLPIPDLDYLLDTQQGQSVKFSQILFCDSKSGDFWNIKNDSKRPECLGKWKNGYTRGIGIYQDSEGWKKMYWVMYW
jgi:hypothetical protein